MTQMGPEINTYYYVTMLLLTTLPYFKSRWVNPQGLTQLIQDISWDKGQHKVRHRQKGITSDSQVNSHFSYRWSQASLTLNNFFLLFSFFKSNKNNKTEPHTTSQTAKEPKQNCRLSTTSNKITGGLQLVFGRPTLALSSALVPQIFSCLVGVEDSKLIIALSKKHRNLK